MITIGKLANKTGVSIDTIRFYERKGVLPEPERTPKGYRLYSEESADKLRFVRAAQQLGFKLDEITDLLKLENDPEADCSAVQEHATSKISEIEQKIEQLNKMREVLCKLTSCCPGADTPLDKCNILTHLYGTDNALDSKED